MGVDAVTHALRWIASRGDTCHHLQWACYKKMEWDWHVSMFDFHLRKRLWLYCPGHAGVKENEVADRLAEKATIISGLRLGRSDLKYWWVWDIICGGQDQGHQTSHHRLPGGKWRGKKKRSSLNVCKNDQLFENHAMHTTRSQIGLVKVPTARIRGTITACSLCPHIDGHRSRFGWQNSGERGQLSG